MPRNKLSDLNNLLFEALERLNDGELKGDVLQEEIARIGAMNGTAAAIVANCSLMLKIRVAQQEYTGKRIELPESLEG